MLGTFVIEVGDVKRWIELGIQYARLSTDVWSLVAFQ